VPIRITLDKSPEVPPSEKGQRRKKTLGGGENHEKGHPKIGERNEKTLTMPLKEEVFKKT